MNGLDKIMIIYWYYNLFYGVHMIQIRPVSDLRNKFSEIEEIVTSTQSPVFLTKNGYGSMVVMSIQSYENITNNIETKLDEADNYSKISDVRLSHDEVFSKLRKKINGKYANTHNDNSWLWKSLRTLDVL